MNWLDKLIDAWWQKREKAKRADAPKIHVVDVPMPPVERAPPKRIGQQQEGRTRCMTPGAFGVSEGNKAWKSNL